VLYHKEWDQPGIHTIALFNMKDDRFSNSQITVDKFELSVPADIQSSTSSASSIESSPSSFSSPQSSLPAASFPLTTSTSSSFNTAADLHRRQPIRAIAGKTVGGLLFVILVACLCTWRIKKRKIASRNPKQLGNITQPYYFAYQMRRYEEHRELYTFSPFRRFRKIPRTKRPVSRRQETNTRHVQSADQSRTGNPIRREPRRALDGGRLSVEETVEDDTQTLPPEYHQVFRRSESNFGAARSVRGNETNLQPVPRRGSRSREEALSSDEKL
jgi:hypothetical protein